MNRPERSHNQSDILKNITFQWIITLSILTVAILGNYFFVSYQIDQIRLADRFLSLANRQAWLFQRAGVFYLFLLKITPLSDRELLHRELIELVKESERNYAELLKMANVNPNDPELIPPDIQKFLEEYLTNLEVFVSRPTDQLPHFLSDPNVASIRKSLEKKENETALNSWIDSYKTKDEEYVHQFHLWILALLLFNLCLLFAIGRFIFYRMSRYIVQQFYALRQSEEEFRSMFELSLVGQAQTNPLTLRFLYVNHKFCKITGYSDAELRNMTAMDITHPDDREMNKIKWQEVLDGKTPELFLEKRYIRKDGSLIWVQVTGTVLRDNRGSPVISSAIIQDISERKKAQEELVTLKDKLATDLASMNRLHALSTRLVQITDFQELLQEILDAIIKLQKADFGHIQLCDKKTNSLKLVAQNGFNQEFLHNPTQESETVFTLALKQRRRVMIEDVDKTEEFPWIRKNAAAAGYRAVQSTPIFGQDGKNLGVISTYCKRPNCLAESDLRLADLLVKLVSELIERKQAEEEVKHYVEELRRSNTDLEQFASIASHDLQEPLKIILTSLNYLVRRYKDKFDQTGLEFMSHMEASVYRMKTLIRDLLAYSKVGRQGETFKEVEAADIVSQAVTNLEVPIRENNATILLSPLCRVNVYETQFVQLFQNLISNALKFRSAEPPTIEIACQERPKEWLFWVRDNGIGISPEYFEKIFMMFYRLHTEDKYTGSGMGLAFCKKIVDLHEGRIWVESDGAHGTTVYFTIAKEKRIVFSS